MSTAPVLQANKTLKIVITKGPHAGETFDLAKETIRIGRSSDNDISLTNDLKASRHHLEINFDGQNFKVKNLSEKNLVIMNGKAITSERIKNNSVVAIGQTEMDLILPIETSSVDTVQPASSAMPVKPPSSPSPMSVPTQATMPAPAPAPAPLLKPSISQHQYQQQQTYSSNNQRPHPSQAYQNPYSQNRTAYSASAAPTGGNKIYFIIAVLVVIAAIFYFSSDSGKRGKARDPFISGAQKEFEEQMTQKKIEELTERKNKLNDPLIKKSMEYMTKGLRDYRQKQYASARESFAVVLNTDPNNELARKYYYLSTSKFDEQIKYQLMQGRRYYETQNYRLCKSSFDVVLRMLINKKSDPSYKEAEENSKKCELALEGRL